MAGLTWSMDRQGNRPGEVMLELSCEESLAASEGDATMV